jgi:Flp pilus assembly protein CpaB
MAATAPARTKPAAKSGARRPLFLIGIVMAVVAFILVLVLGSIVAGRAAAGSAPVGVVVAAHDIHKRHVVAATDLAITQLPATAAPPGAFAQTAQAVGKITQVDVLQGQALTTNLVANTNSGDPGYLPIPSGWIATTIPSSEQQAVAGYPTAGDVIDIQATAGESLFNPTTPTPRQLTRTVFRGIHVIRVGPATSAGPGANGQQGQGVASSLTVLMTPCDSQYLSWLITTVSVRYTLRSDRDYGTLPTGPDGSCPVGSTLGRVGPAEVDSRFGFTKG